MKRLILLPTVLALLAAGCGGGNPDAATTSSAAPTTSVTTSATPAPTTSSTTITTVAETSSSTTVAEASTTSTTGETGEPPSGDLEPGTIAAGVLLVGEEVRTYLVAVPPGYSPDSPAPLLFDLHGRGGTASGQALNSEITPSAWLEGYVVVHPQALGAPPTWRSFPGFEDLAGVEKELAFFDMMIETLSSDLAIDEDRIFVTGFSNGASMAARLACERADGFAAFATVAGAYEGWTDCAPSRPIPLLAIHGIADDMVAFGGAAATLPPVPDWAAWWAAADGCGRDPVATQTVTGWIWHWPLCDDEVTVTLMALDGVGHVWPQQAQVLAQDGADLWVGATWVILDFFAQL